IGASLRGGMERGNELAYEEMAENSKLQKLRQEEERKYKLMQQQQQQENEAFKREFGFDISGINDPKVRQEAFKQAMQLKQAPELQKAKYGARLGALEESGFGKLLQGNQSNQMERPGNAISNEMGESNLVSQRPNSMIPEEAIFKAEAIG